MSAHNVSAVEQRLHRQFISQRPYEAADLLDELDLDEVAAILTDVDESLLAPVVENVAPATWAGLAKFLGTDASARILELVNPARAAAHLRVMDEQTREQLLLAVNENQRADVRLLLDCPADSAGAVMDPRVVHLRPHMTVAQAIERLRVQQHDKRIGAARRVMFVVDAERRLQGIVAIQDLALAEPEQSVRDYMQAVPALVAITAGKADIVAQLEKHRLSSLPVVDAQGHLVGVVRYEELVSAAKEDASADLQAMFGASRDEKALSPPLFAVRKRLPWLQINLLTAFVAASVVSVFEDTIAKYTALAVLLPVVAGQSGNTGAQALAVIIRGLALREISIAHWRRTVFKEASVGLINGLAVAATTALGVFLWSRSLGLTLVIGTSMVISMVIAGVAGAGIPLMLTRLGQDPAQSSSIVLTTVTDIAGFFSFLGIATLFITLL